MWSMYSAELGPPPFLTLFCTIGFFCLTSLDVVVDLLVPRSDFSWIGSAFFLLLVITMFGISETLKKWGGLCCHLTLQCVQWYLYMLIVPPPRVFTRFGSPQVMHGGFGFMSFASCFPFPPSSTRCRSFEEGLKQKKKWERNNFFFCLELWEESAKTHFFFYIYKWDTCRGSWVLQYSSCVSTFFSGALSIHIQLQRRTSLTSWAFAVKATTLH